MPSDSSRWTSKENATLIRDAIARKLGSEWTRDGEEWKSETCRISVTPVLRSRPRSHGAPARGQRLRCIQFWSRTIDRVGVLYDGGRSENLDYDENLDVIVDQIVNVFIPAALERVAIERQGNKSDSERKE